MAVSASTKRNVGNCGNKSFIKLQLNGIVFPHEMHFAMPKLFQ